MDKSGYGFSLEVEALINQHLNAGTDSEKQLARYLAECIEDYKLKYPNENHWFGFRY